MMNGMNETGDHNNSIGAAFNDELKKLTNILRQKPNEQPRNLPTLTVESTHETGLAKLKKLKNANKQN